MYEHQDSLIQCYYSILFCVNSNSLNLLLFVTNNRNGSSYIGTVHPSSELSRGLGDRMRVKLITDRDLELVPHVCSYCMIKS